MNVDTNATIKELANAIQISPLLKSSLYQQREKEVDAVLAGVALKE
jgi:hypothetical protein